MGSQVFRSIPDSVRLFELLERVCDDREKWFVVSEMSFRRLIRDDRLQKFCELLKENYHSSKQFYLAKHRTFNGFLTILRQLCKVLCIGYLSKICYSHSQYSKILEIYVPRKNWRGQVLVSRKLQITRVEPPDHESQ